MYFIEVWSIIFIGVNSIIINLNDDDDLLFILILFLIVLSFGVLGIDWSILFYEVYRFFIII